jgi:hypothetical protein
LRWKNVAIQFKARLLYTFSNISYAYQKWLISNQQYNTIQYNFPNIKANKDKNKQERLFSISFQLFWQPEGAWGGFNHF